MHNDKFPYMLQFARDGFSCYISHLDWIRNIQVALDITRLSIVYTEGYSPKAKMKFSPPLPVGLHSDTELVLIYLRDNLPEEIIQNEFEHTLPNGISLLNVRYLYPQPPKNPFQSINGALYEMYFPMELNITEKRAILDSFNGQNLYNDAPEIIKEQHGWVIKILNPDEFIVTEKHLNYIASLESGRTFHPVKFALALKEHLNLTHLPHGRRLSFVNIQPDSARKLFQFND
ncbi:TIGR03936 family radical SAM-associated protein [bacterium]|nr:TIGR03936 family radical SAM-associated protein [bacterium]MBU1024860.1 TIGR03936 family radical SAM-associated protein [bacterium]